MKVISMEENQHRNNLFLQKIVQHDHFLQGMLKVDNSLINNFIDVLLLSNIQHN